MAPPKRGVTRRRLLATGGAAGAAAAFGVRFPDAAAAADASDGVPGYLIRSSYSALSTPRFTVGITTMELQAVTDLQDADLAGSEDAFSLLFATAMPLETAIQRFSHPDLGEFEFFIAPIERSGMYEVVVNRSVGAPKHYPRPSRNAATPGAGPAAPPKPGAKPPKGAPRVRRGHVRSVAARRLARGFACGIALEPGSNVKSATVWLVRNGLVVASTHVKRVHGRRIAVSVPTTKRPRGGRYDVTVRTKDHDGHVEYELTRLSLT